MEGQERADTTAGADPGLSGVDPDLSGPGRRRRSLRAHGAVLAALALGGAVGALSRYVVDYLVPAGAGQFPWGTFWTNVTGSAALGFAMLVMLETLPRTHLARPLIGTGLIGAYTTFSTFVVGALLLLRDGRDLTALAYLASTLLGGFLAAWAGMGSGRLAVRAGTWLRARGGEQ